MRTIEYATCTIFTMNGDTAPLDPVHLAALELAGYSVRSSPPANLFPYWTYTVDDAPAVAMLLRDLYGYRISKDGSI